MLSDLHLHTSFSGDSDTPPEKQIERAISLGMKQICITDHHDHDVISDCDFELDIPSYFAEMTRLRERYSGKIDISIGVELGLQLRLANYLEAVAAEYLFDFIIGSVHFVDGIDPYFPEFWEGRTEEQSVERYFETALGCVKNIKCFDSFGHLDYFIRYAKEKNRNYSYEKYADFIDPILKTLAEDGKALECNSGGFKAGLNAPNPCPAILKRFRELGGERITVGSDAHDPEYIGHEFERCREILLDCGYSYYAVYKNRRAEMIKL